MRLTVVSGSQRKSQQSLVRALLQNGSAEMLPVYQSAW